MSKDRPRYSFAKIEKYFRESESNTIDHVIYNEDTNDFSIMSHIVCEYCLYCEQENSDNIKFMSIKVSNYVENPYPNHEDEE